MVMHTHENLLYYAPSLPAPLAGPYQVAPASDQAAAQGRKARALMAMKQDKTTTTPICCLEAMPAGSRSVGLASYVSNDLAIGGN
jgi:hypothetical protein